MKTNILILLFAALLIGQGCKKKEGEPVIPAGITILSDSPNKNQYTQGTQFCRNGIQLPDGRVYFVGGSKGQDLNNLQTMEPEVYDPTTDTWTTIPNWAWEPSRYAGKLLVLPNNKLLYIRGEDIYGHKSFYFYIINPQISFTAQQKQSPCSGEELQDAALMTDGQVIIITNKGHYFTYDPVNDIVSPTLGETPKETFYTTNYTYGAKVVALANGGALITGGLGQNSNTQNHFAYRYPAGVSSQLADGRFDHYAVALPDGKAVVFGGGAFIGLSTHLSEMYDPVTDTWAVLSDANSNAIALSQSFEYIGNDKVFGLACVDGGNLTNYGIYNLANHTESKSQELQSFLTDHFKTGICVVKLSNGDLLINGINGNDVSIKSTVRYTPQ